jgi:hypothetical protein
MNNIIHIVGVSRGSGKCDSRSKATDKISADSLAAEWEMNGAFRWRSE